jgi:subtilisin family serine protease
MVRFSVVAADEFATLNTGDAFRPTRAPLDVVSTPPGSPAMIVDVPTDYESAMEHMMRLEDVGAIESGWTLEPEDYHPLGIIHPRPHGFLPLENIMGKDFAIIGVTPQWQELVRYGIDIPIAIADTGTPPRAARDAWFSEVPIVSLDNIEDTHGHATACGSRTGGKLGVLRRCKLGFVAAIPGGSGSASTVANAFKLATERGYKRINASLGGSYDRVISDMVKWCQSQGTTIICAAGNDGERAVLGSPADAARVVVGATTFDGASSAPFSSGLNMWAQEDCATPGHNVGLAHLDGGYGTGSGTSFSAPVVTAVVAAMCEKL